MARQRGIIKLDGTISDITFLKTRDGYMAKEKSEIKKDKILNDATFNRTRENMAEFGRAGKAGRMLRASLQSVIKTIRDHRMSSRLTQSLMHVLKADITNQRGMRTVPDGDLKLLEGFDFNIHGKLNTSLFAPYSASITRASGLCSVSIAPFDPSVMVIAPAGTTHFQITAAATELDFATGSFVTQLSDTGKLPWDGTTTAAIQLSNTLTAGTTLPIFLLLGIEFFQEINGSMYALKNGAFNALAVVKVEV